LSGAARHAAYAAGQAAAVAHIAAHELGAAAYAIKAARAAAPEGQAAVASIEHTCGKIEVEHSIVLEQSVIRDLPHLLEDSLIGRYVEISRSPLKPKAYRLSLGDHSTVGVL
jgi:hypothetical protein